MITKRLLHPQRLRTVPTQFSWLDHRLVRDRYLDRCSSEALALYLFLVTVADVRGLSYYGDSALCQRLGWEAAQCERARDSLIDADLIAYQAPLYQVLSLEPAAARPSRGLRHIAAVLRDAGSEG